MSVTSFQSVRAKINDVVARIQPLPLSLWQVKARVIVGVVTFFDAFDELARNQAPAKQ